MSVFLFSIVNLMLIFTKFNQFFFCVIYNYSKLATRKI
jgi:hypothetical protein